MDPGNARGKTCLHSRPLSPTASGDTAHLCCQCKQYRLK